jgi:aminoglycoside 6'-N-acetyltransferase I
MSMVNIRRAKLEDKPEWLRMRLLLWPDNLAEALSAGMEEMLAHPDEEPVFIAVRADNTPCGFLEGGTRKYGEGCETSPIGYIEGWYVDGDQRRMGVGGALVSAMEDWAREHGLTEMGSDTWLENEISITAHQKLGYIEMERLVHFAKKL